MHFQIGRGCKKGANFQFFKFSSLLFVVVFFQNVYIFANFYFDTAAVCNKALGMKSGAIRNKQITASSEWDKYHNARLSRLGTVKRGRYRGAWSARHNNHHQWLKVDFRRPMKIKKIVTKGRQDTNQWVTRYQVTYSQDGTHWTMYRYKSNDVVRIISGTY